MRVGESICYALSKPEVVFIDGGVMQFHCWHFHPDSTIYALQCLRKKRKDFVTFYVTQLPTIHYITLLNIAFDVKDFSVSFPKKGSNVNVAIVRYIKTYRVPFHSTLQFCRKMVTHIQQNPFIDDEKVNENFIKIAEEKSVLSSFHV